MVHYVSKLVGYLNLKMECLVIDLLRLPHRLIGFEDMVSIRPPVVNDSGNTVDKGYGTGEGNPQNGQKSHQYLNRNITFNELNMKFTVWSA